MPFIVLFIISYEIFVKRFNRCWYLTKLFVPQSHFKVVAYGTPTASSAKLVSMVYAAIPATAE